MYSKALIVLAVAALAKANDLFIAVSNNTEGHEEIFDQHFQADWAITRQTKDIVVNATSGVICLVNVTDLRPSKDGEARITSGGTGQKNVTITLRSPAAFRGYDFRVQVYTHMHDDVERNDHDVEAPEEIVENDNKTARPEVTSASTSTTGAEVTTDVTGLTGDLELGKPIAVTTGKPNAVTTGKADIPAIEIGMHRLPKEMPEMEAFVQFHPPRHGN